MKRRTAILAATAVSAASGATAREQLIGVWKLISYVRHRDGKTDHPYTERPVGRITYDSAGRMSAQLMRPGRKSTVPSGVSFVNGRASDAEIKEAVNGFIAYYGSYRVDEASQTVIHHVEACLVPSWVGTDLVRKYKFSGNRVMLSAAAANFTVDLVWERESS